MEPIVLEPTQSVFDLDSKSDVTLYKQVTFTPVDNTKEALERVGNDSAAFLKIINDGLCSYTAEQAKQDSSIPWMAKDDEDNLVPFTGTTISENASKQLSVHVLSLAKLLYDYAKDMPREDKRKAKEQAQAQILSNPAIVDKLKATA